MPESYVDPTLTRFIEDRVLASLNKEFPGVDSPKRFVVHGQECSNVLQAVATALDGLKVPVYVLGEEPPQIPEDVKLCVLTNGPLYFKHDLRDHPAVMLVINNMPVDGKAQQYWDAAFNYQMTYGTPPVEYFCKYFAEMFPKLSEEDCAYLAECADSCTEEDAKRFCERVIWEATFADTEITLDWLKDQEMFIMIQNTKYPAITQRNTLTEQARFDVEPVNKKCKFV